MSISKTTEYKSLVTEILTTLLKNRSFTTLHYIIIFCIQFLLLIFLNNDGKSIFSENLYNLEDPEMIDNLDYYYISKNLANYGKYPLVGNIGDNVQNYQIDTSHFYNYVFFDIFNKNGATYIYNRQPIVSVLYATIFKFSNNQVLSMRLLNLLQLALIGIAVIHLSFTILNKKNILIIIGCFLGITLMKSYFFVFTLNPFLLPSLLIITTIICIIEFLDKCDSKYLFFTISLLTINFLTSLYTIFSFFFLIIFLYLKQKNQTKNLLMAISCSLITIITWTIFINIHKHNHLENRREWIKNYKVDVIPKKGFLPYESTKKFIWEHYKCLVMNDKPFLISDVYVEENILHVHNEYNLKKHNLLGNLNVEWKENPDSYYNNDNKELDNRIRVLIFYWKNPDLFIKNHIKRIDFSMNSRSFLFWLSGILLIILSLYTIKNKPLTLIFIYLSIILLKIHPSLIFVLISIYLLPISIFLNRKYIYLALINIFWLSHFLLVIIVLGSSRMLLTFIPISIMVIIICIDEFLLFVKSHRKVAMAP